MPTLRELHEDATPGPWYSDAGTLWVVGEGYHGQPRDADGEPFGPYAEPYQQQEMIGGGKEQDAALIVAVRNALPEIIDALERLAEHCEEVRTELTGSGLDPNRITQDGYHEGLWEAVQALREKGLI